MSIETQELATRYGAAWAAHDLDAIMAVHTDDTVFHLHGGGEPAMGRVATRKAFAAAASQWPDIRFEKTRVYIGLLMFFGMFGSIFLLSQFFQTVQGYSPFGSGLRILPWTLAPIFIAPIAGAMSDKLPAKNIIGVGLTLQATGLAWMAAVSTPTVAYSHLVGPFILAGVGMALFFAPVANVVLSAVRSEEEGKASGANNAIRELGGVLGVAVLASIFAHAGGYRTSTTFVNGLTTAVYVGAAVVAVGAVAAFAIPRKRKPREIGVGVPEPAFATETA